MKTVEVNIRGDSNLAYVSFYNKEILRKLQDMEEGEYDFIDFSNEHEKKTVFLGRGYCEDGDLTVSVKIDGEHVYDGNIFRFEYFGDSEQELKERFKEDCDEEFDETLSANMKDVIFAHEHYFQNANQFDYCSLECVECYVASDKLTILVEKDFKLSDLNFILLSIPDFGQPNITHNLAKATRLEHQIFGVEYKGKCYEFLGENNEGGSNEIHWFERNGETWTESEVIQERIGELEAW